MKIVKSSIQFNKVILRLVFSHSFAILTIFGNLIIIGFSLIFFFLENQLNPNVNLILDAIWWGFSTATTVGYGDIIPVTSAGKVLGIILMLVGTALFATYTALFARTILEDDLFRFSHDFDEEKDDFLEDLKKHRKVLEKQIKHLEQKTKS